jgi:amino-acid N-acetyltransferase
MKSEINIQKAQSQDLSLIRKLLDRCDLPSQDLGDDHMKHFQLIKAAGKVVGTIGLEIHDSEGLLRSLAVHPSHRGQGFGKKLTEQIETYARRKDIGRIYLLTTTAESFFSERGYQEVSREKIPEQMRQSPQFSEICPSTAVAMYKVLC